MTPTHIATLRKFINENPAKHRYIDKNDGRYDAYCAWHEKVLSYLKITEASDVVELFKAKDSHPASASAVLEGLVSKHDTTTPGLSPETDNKSIEKIVEAKLSGIASKPSTLGFFKIAVLSAIVSTVTFYILIDPIKQHISWDSQRIDRQLAEISERLYYMREHDNDYISDQLFERTTRAECKKWKTIVDLKTGSLSGLTPKTPAKVIEKQFPCFTYSGETDDDVNYGGGVFYSDHAFYFYTKAHAIEIRSSFRGVLSSPEDPSLSDGNNPWPTFMRHGSHNKGSIEKELEGFNLLPEYIKTTISGATSREVYQAPYGCLILDFKEYLLFNVVITNNTCSDEAKFKRFIRDS